MDERKYDSGQEVASRISETVRRSREDDVAGSPGDSGVASSSSSSSSSDDDDSPASSLQGSPGSVHKSRPEENLTVIMHDIDPISLVRQTIRVAKAAQVLALRLGGVIQKKEPVFSQPLTDLFNEPAYVSQGPEPFKSIKGCAAMGFFADLIARKEHELLTLMPYDLCALKRAFLKARGIEASDEALEEVDMNTLAIWQVLEIKILIVPSSGSFATGFAQVYAGLLQLKIKIMGQEVPVVDADNVRRMQLLLPQAGRDLIPPGKLEEVSRMAFKIRADVIHWSKDRDFQAWDMVMEIVDAVYCSTNLASPQEVLKFISHDMTFRGAEYFSTHAIKGRNSRAEEKRIREVNQRLRTLEYHGVYVTVNEKGEATARVQNGIVAGCQGLAVISLDALNAVCATYPVQEAIPPIRSFHQSSAGTTWTAAAIVSAVIEAYKKNQLTEDDLGDLKDNWPHLYERLQEAKQNGHWPVLLPYGVYDPNSPALAKQFGAAPKNLTLSTAAPSGLWTQSDGCSAFEIISKMTEYSGREVSKDMMFIAPPFMMKIAALVLYVEALAREGDKAQYPEPAGAAGMAAILYDKFIRNELTGNEVAQFLRQHHVDKDVFVALLRVGNKDTGGDPWENFIAQAAIFDKQCAQDDAAQRFMDGFREGLLASTEPVKEARSFDVLSSPIIITMTGSNGTESYIAAHKQAMRDQQIPPPLSQMVKTEAASFAVAHGNAGPPPPPPPQ